MNRAIGFVVLALVLRASLALGLPNVAGGSVRTQVSDRDGLGIVELTYTLTNDSPSDAAIFLFSLDVERPDQSAALNGDGLTIDEAGEGNRPFDEVRGDVQLGVDDVIPVGCEAPEGWVCLLSSDRTLFWSFLDPAYGVAPGQGRGGFSMKSPALPAIRDAFVQPVHFVETAGEEFQESDRARAADEMGEIRVPVRVLGVRAPPEPLVLSEFVAHLEGQAAEARALGWISDDATFASIAARLETLKLALAEGREEDAKMEANSVLSEVESTSCEVLACPLPLSSEARGLLRENVRFVRGKLPNEPPDCTRAAPEEALLWPPDHTMVEVSIEGVSDPDGDPLEISGTSITQDEEVLGDGSGSTCPDGHIQPNGGFEVRRERTGPGSGRVYRIEFSATDTAAESCGGVVEVCVPKRKKGTCVDETANVYDSTECH